MCLARAVRDVFLFSRGMEAIFPHSMIAYTVGHADSGGWEKASFGRKARVVLLLYRRDYMDMRIYVYCDVWNIASWKGWMVWRIQLRLGWRR